MQYCNCAASKLPEKWEVEGTNMAYRVAYLVALYKILLELVVNIDQTGIHLVSTSGSQTWEKRGAKDIKVPGIEDKRQIIAVHGYYPTLPAKIQHW
jgi:hypothetical protein